MEVNKETLPKGWTIGKFEDLLDYIQPTNHIVKSTDYNDTYPTPVLTAGKSFIIGYTNETDGIFTKLPTIIFDDFTTATQFVNFSFKVKSSAMKILQPACDRVNLKFAYYYMQTINLKGETHKRFWISEYSKLSVPLPPLAEQHRIVAKIEELFSELDKGIETLKTAQQQLKVYRQAVLKYAFEGRLTNPDVKEGELPEGWVSRTFLDVSSKIGDIDHKMPTRVSDGIYPYFSTSDITGDNKLNFDTAKLISKEDYERLSKKIKPERGDIVFPRYGTIGRNVLVDTDRSFLVSYSCAIIKPNRTIIDNKYLYLYTLSPLTRKEIEKHVVETTQANVGVSSIKAFRIVYPTSIEKQSVIVQEIESRLSVCDKIEEGIQQGLQQAEALRQSILKKAFEGKLVPQNPNDEPASVLLERIKADRERHQQKTKTKTKKT